MPTRLLCLADLHLGRTPRLPAGAGADLDGARLGPAAAWDRAVKLALAERVDGVLLAGDVVDQENARFEAFGPLHDGVRQLLAAGIAVCGVAGNHDVQALPRLAAALDGFRLLGEGGLWQTTVIGTDPAVRILGWSFPTLRYRESPLAGEGPVAALAAAEAAAVAEAAAPTAEVTLGLLHADLLAVDSPYAPVSAADLRRVAGVRTWLLGHVHRPSLPADGTEPGYLGSLVGLDPSETGPHGAWLATIDRAGRLALRQVPLAPLRWEQVTIDLDGLDHPADGLERRLRDALAAAADAVLAPAASAAAPAAADGAPPVPPPLALGCRVVLRGRVGRQAELRQALAALGEDFGFGSGLDLRVFLAGEPEDRTRPALDLAALARGDDPLALLAADLARLEAGDGDEELLAEARARLDELTLREFPETSLTDEELRRLLLRSGWRALETLLAQREGAA